MSLNFIEVDYSVYISLQLDFLLDIIETYPCLYVAFSSLILTAIKHSTVRTNQNLFFHFPVDEHVDCFQCFLITMPLQDILEHENLCMYTEIYCKVHA